MFMDPNKEVICPTCNQRASLAMSDDAHKWECINEACVEYGQVIENEQD